MYTGLGSSIVEVKALVLSHREVFLRIILGLQGLRTCNPTPGVGLYRARYTPRLPLVTLHVSLRSNNVRALPEVTAF